MAGGSRKPAAVRRMAADERRLRCSASATHIGLCHGVVTEGVGRAEGAVADVEERGKDGPDLVRRRGKEIPPGP